MGFVTSHTSTSVNARVMADCNPGWKVAVAVKEKSTLPF
jgi:hypothetical protein